MYKALIYKEWLKVKWACLVMAVLSFLTLIYMALELSHNIELNSAKAIWSFVIYQKYVFFGDIKYVILASGIVLAVIQFFAEMNADRLKLTLHLPVEEKKLLLQMVSIGLMFLLVLYFAIVVSILIISGIYFPSEVGGYSFTIMLPWLIAGLTAYLATSTIIVEPIWTRRIELLVIFIGYLFFFDIPLDYSSAAIVVLLTFSVFFGLFILISGYHFKRGIKS